MCLMFQAPSVGITEPKQDEQGGRHASAALHGGNMAWGSAPGVISYGFEAPLHIARSQSALQGFKPVCHRRTEKMPGPPSTIYVSVRMWGGVRYWASELSVAGHKETQDRRCGVRPRGEIATHGDGALCRGWERLCAHGSGPHLHLHFFLLAR